MAVVSTARSALPVTMQVNLIQGGRNGRCHANDASFDLVQALLSVRGRSGLTLVSFRTVQTP